MTVEGNDFHSPAGKNGIISGFRKVVCVYKKFEFWLELKGVSVQEPRCVSIATRKLFD